MLSQSQLQGESKVEQHWNDVLKAFGSIDGHTLALTSRTSEPFMETAAGTDPAGDEHNDGGRKYEDYYYRENYLIRHRLHSRRITKILETFFSGQIMKNKH